MSFRTMCKISGWTPIQIQFFSFLAVLLSLAECGPLEIGHNFGYGYSNEDGCGQTVGENRDSKILGGEPVESSEEFPWMVSIQAKRGGGHLCGGFVVSRRHIISAAHCFASTYNPHLQQEG